MEVMGEAILTRAAGEPEIQLTPTPGYHTILVTLRDTDGRVIPDFKLNCLDGSTYYNYTTNESGQCIFQCNSGSANIYFNNNFSGIPILDLSSGWLNVDAPVGLTSKVNFNLNTGNAEHIFYSNKLFNLYLMRECDLNIIGGGGGGGAPSSGVEATGGGAGYMNYYENQKLHGTYNFIAGSGGAGTVKNQYHVVVSNAGTGGTSYIVNTNYSAVGGSPGKSGRNYYAPGGLGNGGTYAHQYGGSSASITNTTCYGGNSPVWYAGGGGAGAATWSPTADGGGYTWLKAPGGSPYGGYSASGNGWYGGSGSNGGGGGAASNWRNDIHIGGDGGGGVMRIYIHY